MCTLKNRQQFSSWRFDIDVALRSTGYEIFFCTSRIWVFIDETGWIKDLQRMDCVAWGVALNREYCAVITVKEEFKLAVSVI